MKFENGYWYHVYNRGNNRQPIFFTDRNYLFFENKMLKHLKLHCDIVAYCLMPNHFHWLIRVKESLNIRRTTGSGLTNDSCSSFPEIDPLNRSIAILLSSYTKAINNERKRSGSLFKQKTKAKLLTVDAHNYPLICFHYIHQNPLRAGIVGKLEDWPYSSYLDYTSRRNRSLVDVELGLTSMGISSPENFVTQTALSLDLIKANNLK